MVLELKILEKDLKKGIVKLVPENQDDLWILYSIIKPGDIVKAQTTREIKGEHGGGSRRIPMTLAVQVKTLEFQPFTERLRIRGVVVEGPEKYGVKGHYHTLNIETGRPIIIVKEHWPAYIVKRILKASAPRGRLLLVALDYDEAKIALLGEQGVKSIYTGYSSLGGKRSPEDYERNLEAYLDEAATRIVEAVEREGAGAVIIASPGGLAERLRRKLVDRGLRAMVIVDHVSIGGDPGIRELIHRDSVREAIKELSLVKAARILEEFKRRIVKEPDLVAYGLKEVEVAVSLNAVDKILVHESLLRTYDEEIRERIDRLLDDAYRRGAEIVIVPRNSDISNEVEAFTGLIALLRYKLNVRQSGSKMFYR